MYPLFEIPTVGGPMLIASIATFHILPSHVATGAFWMAYFIERKAITQNQPELMEFLKRFTLSILIFCFVTGSLTGVGIWYSATAISPRAISGLIHNYVWGWATEWVFFIIEIVTIYVYFYTFGKVSDKTHLRIGLLYALAAWISMVIITGILGFMMTPGKWLSTGGFFDGFFNETYWPQLFTRTSMMFAIAGSYAAIVAGTLKDGGRDTIRKIAGRWGLGGIIAGALFTLWYYTKLPASALENIQQIAYTSMMLKVSLVVGVVMALYFLLLALGKGGFVSPAVGILMMVVLFAGIGGGESVREISRRPYLIPGYMYSNQIIGHDMSAKGVSSEVDKFNEEGILKNYPFIPEDLRVITADNYLKAGEVITKLECIACHTMESGGRNSLADLESGLTAEDIVADILDDLASSYMPPFVGTEVEKRAAAAYMAEVLTDGEAPDAEWVVNGN